jgi:hypothetical protein
MCPVEAGLWPSWGLSVSPIPRWSTATTWKSRASAGITSRQAYQFSGQPAEILGAPPPRRVSEEEAEQQIGAQAVYYGTQLRAASNAKAKSELGLTLEYPPWREGFRELFG